MRPTIVLAVLFLVFQSVVAQSAMAQNKGDSPLQVREEDGGSVAVRTANGVRNQDSSLKRTWYVIEDPKAPAVLNHGGVSPRLDDKEMLQYFIAVATVSPRQLISAVEVRYVLFDVWGKHMRTLSLTELADSSTHIDFRGSNKWVALESEASQLLTVVGFVARVRMADGAVWAFDASRMASQVEDLGLNVAPADLIPDEQRIIDPRLIYCTYPSKSGEAVKARGSATTVGRDSATPE